jgi:tripartite-type tricarboxylate transporter receptor subunit TctC
MSPLFRNAIPVAANPRHPLNLSRRNFLQLGGATLLSPLGPALGAQMFPSRPVRIIVGFATGGPNDISARLIAQWLSQRLGQQVIVENRPGAGSNVATESVIHAAADGYTLLLVPAPAAINATLYHDLNFNFIRDIAPVAGIARVPEVMVVNPSVPARTVEEFVAYAKANPGKINMATAGNGTVPHVAGELFKYMTGVNLVTVGYRGGGPALIDLLAGQVQMMFEPTLSTLPHIKAGKLRALAVTSAQRSEALPDVPALNEFVPGYEATAWFGIGAPRKVPNDIIDRLNHEINACLDNAKFKDKLVSMGGTPMPMLPHEFGALIASETEKWAKVIKFAGIRAD